MTFLSFPLIITPRRLSKAALDDLIRETNVNEVKGSKFSDLLFTNKKTKVKLQYKYLLETADESDITELCGLEIDAKMVEAIDNDLNACDYFIGFLEIAKAA
ncbi:hypothetical protein GQ607_012886 [Colletotrichum asianum]|uniref:Uncharacterized protein n=1 Tax=Colletotrichum asianum TaxID=702518 RepID=A0A8H3ZHZ8_9PEZI|nr:hypothetical protein GQ607_012886 [Colletotrichum asianum]